MPAAEARIVTGPVLDGAVNVTVTRPLESVVPEAGMLPAVAWKLTAIPCKGLLLASTTVAVMLDVLFTAGEALPSAKLTPLTGLTTAETLMLADCAKPDANWPLTVSAPALEPAVYVLLAWPLVSVVRLKLASVAPLALAVKDSVTGSPVTRLPLASVTTALMVDCPPGPTVPGAAETVRAEAAPATKLTAVVALKPDVASRAVTVERPVTVLLFKVTIALPVVSVVAVAALTDPALGMNPIDLPLIGCPAVSSKVAVSKVVEAPSASTLACADESVKDCAIPVGVPTLPPLLDTQSPLAAL